MGGEKKDGMKVPRSGNWIRMMLRIGIRNTEQGMNLFVVGHKENMSSELNMFSWMPPSHEQSSPAGTWRLGS